MGIGASSEDFACCGGRPAKKDEDLVAARELLGDHAPAKVEEPKPSLMTAAAANANSKTITVVPPAAPQRASPPAKAPSPPAVVQAKAKLSVPSGKLSIPDGKAALDSPSKWNVNAPEFSPRPAWSPNAKAAVFVPKAVVDHHPDFHLDAPVFHPGDSAFGTEALHADAPEFHPGDAAYGFDVQMHLRRKEMLKYRPVGAAFPPPRALMELKLQKIEA